ncbi:MAG TPA: hypothetical protein VFD97_02540, partial [Acidimicrobiia bacterium]|nr:hypothetical protein [Acidimicrobiia bacterium]
MRRALVFTLIAAAVLAGLALFARSDRFPDLGFDASVPDDLRALAAETWQDFLAAHDARRD